MRNEPRCPFIFKNKECGYQGDLARCDKAQINCIVRGGNWDKLLRANAKLPKASIDPALLKTSTEGRKDDSEKLRYDLMPPEALEGTVHILTFGAKKYTQTIKTDLQGALTWILNSYKKENGKNKGQAVIRIDLFTPMGFVVSATNENYEEQTLNLPKDKDKTGEHGPSETPTGSGPWQKNEKIAPKQDIGTPSLIDAYGFSNTASTKNFSATSLPYRMGNAGFVAKIYPLLPEHISTTTMRQGMQGDCFVVSAITVSECLGMILTACSELLDISGAHPLPKFNYLNEKVEIVLSGERNWEKGILYSRVYAALMRHMQAFWSGEDLDPETGRSHLDHAACCISFLQTYVKRGMAKWDDRPVKKEMPE